MAGGAVTLAQQYLAAPFAADLILATDMVDLATFLALTRKQLSHVPAVLYMHENQLTYPLPNNKESGPMRRNWGVRERQYVLINWKAQLTADAILFNSHHHHDVWFDTLPYFLKHYPEHNGLETIEQLKAKSDIMPVGIDLHRLDRHKPTTAPPANLPPLILWNQRWEFDKAPEQFFAALRQIKTEKRPFRLALCGESFQQKPDHFHDAQTEFAAELIHYGFADQATYGRLLWQADIVLSTAIHEFFGISILEAIYTATFPILPNRLSYPELMPQAWHGRCLYDDSEQLLDHLRWALDHPAEAKNGRTDPLKDPPFL